MSDTLNDAVMDNHALARALGDAADCLSDLRCYSASFMEPVGWSVQGRMPVDGKPYVAGLSIATLTVRDVTIQVVGPTSACAARQGRVALALSEASASELRAALSRLEGQS